MAMRTGHRTLAGIIATTATLAGARPASAEPPADPGPDQQPAVTAADTPILPLAGNFVGDARSEVFEYGAGTAPDLLLENFQLDAFGNVQVTPHAFTVNGTYTPIVGDFDGNGYDDIYWYSPSTTDVIWSFVDTTQRTQTTLNAPAGTFTPVAGDFTGDGADDVLWYQPGAGAEIYWDFDPGSTFTHSTPTSPQVVGTHTPVVGRFVGAPLVDDIIWYRKDATRAATFWNFEGAAPATITGTSLGSVSVGDPDTKPLALDARSDGYKDVLWYNTGSTSDPFWNFAGAATPDTSTTYQQDGTYKAATGDLFGDGHDDVYWRGSCSSIWNFTGPGPQDFSSPGFGCGSLAALGQAATQAATDGHDVTVTFTDDGAVLAPAE